ncbi:MAG: ABC transporter substrate-binding protein [Myxococcota bacterium]
MRSTPHPHASTVLRTAVLVMAWTLASCVHVASAAPSRVPTVVSDALHHLDDGREAVIADLEASRETARPSQLAIIELHLAEQYRLAGRYEDARRLWTTLLPLERPASLPHAVRLGLALLDVQEDRSEEHLNTAASLASPHALSSQRADLELLLYQRATAAGADSSAHAEAATELSSHDPLHHQQVIAALGDLGSAQPQAGTRGRTAIDRAHEALERGEDEEARAIAARLLDEADATPHPEAEAVLALVEAAPLRPDVVCALLPMSGRYASVGRQVEAALRYGWARSGVEASLEVADSGASADAAVAAFRTLVLEQGCIAVVGPMVAEAAHAVALAAEHFHVPLLSLSKGLEDPGDRRWVFQGVVTPRQQVQALLDHLVHTNGLTRFAIFAPDSGYGAHAAKVFEEEAVQRDAVIDITVLYAQGTEDLGSFAQQLGRKDYEARADEFARMVRAAKEKGRDTRKLVLPPLMDFEAIFIPEGASQLPIVSAELAFEEFPIGKFRAYDDKPVPLLGLSGWNQSSIIIQGGAYVENGVFTDVFVPPPREAGLDWYPEPEWKTFVSEYRNLHARTPRPTEAIAADVGLILAQTMAQEPQTRSDFHAALMSTVPGSTITGIEGFDAESHELQRRIRVHSVDRSGFIPLLPDPPDDTQEDAPPPAE